MGVDLTNRNLPIPSSESVHVWTRGLFGLMIMDGLAAARWSCGKVPVSELWTLAEWAVAGFVIMVSAAPLLVLAIRCVYPEISSSEVKMMRWWWRVEVMDLTPASYPKIAGWDVTAYAKAMRRDRWVSLALWIASCLRADDRL